MHRGVFVHGHTLDRYIPEDDVSQADYFNARRIVNPREINSRPAVVRAMAEAALQWEAILRASRTSLLTPQPTSDTLTGDETETDETEEAFRMFLQQGVKGICFPDDSNTAVVKGFIGGESHDVYITHFNKGEKVTAKIESLENRASFTVETHNFEPLDFGNETNKGSTWTAEIPKTAPYYIDVVAHPEAEYTLELTVELAE